MSMKEGRSILMKNEKEEKEKGSLRDGNAIDN